MAWAATTDTSIPCVKIEASRQKETRSMERKQNRLGRRGEDVHSTLVLVTREESRTWIKVFRSFGKKEENCFFLRILARGRDFDSYMTFSSIISVSQHPKVNKTKTFRIICRKGGPDLESVSFYPLLFALSGLTVGHVTHTNIPSPTVLKHGFVARVNGQ